MAELDSKNKTSRPTNTLLATPESFDFEVDEAMEDHDMLYHHVAQGDHELYAMDCCLSDMMSI